MNAVKMSDYEILSDFTKSKDTLKILIVGNSITTHGKLDKIGWLYKSGMAASSEEKDYVHLLFQQFKKDTDKNIILRYANFLDLESYPDKFNLTDFKINNFYTFRPNLTIFQLGDNTSLETQKAYREKSIQFLKNLNSDQIFVVSPFFSTKFNYKTSKEISIEGNYKFIDISSLRNDKSNTAMAKLITL